MRLFFALEIEKDPLLEELHVSLKGISSNLKPVRPHNQHITLKFLGDPGCPLDAVKDAPRDLAKRLEPFEVQIDGMGAFPGWSKPSVIWLGLEPAEKLKELAATLDRTLNEKLGTPLERRDLRAHITAARIKGGGPIPVGRVKDIMGSALDRLSKRSFIIRADSFHLINSTLTPHGPVYEILETYHLMGQ